MLFSCCYFLFVYEQDAMFLISFIQFYLLCSIIDDITFLCVILAFETFFFLFFFLNLLMVFFLG